ncbi:hypothetical protein [Streptomyces sp. SS]|uniref:hypothetical protein n=1 Tax=Streptomyces sp. SS TaxID=260742 RepID=UPI000366C5D2|nr:hypothetical protein [Streptomyces sp. SS]
MRTPARRLVAALAVTGALLALPACASSVDPIERLGRKAAERVSPRPSPAGEVREAGETRDARETRQVRQAVDAVDAKGCRKRREAPSEPRPVTPRSDELALRLTEC